MRGVGTETELKIENVGEIFAGKKRGGGVRLEGRERVVGEGTRGR